MSDRLPGRDVAGLTMAQLRAQIETGALTAVSLVETFVDRIAAVDSAGPSLRAVIELNQDAHRDAEELDRERREQNVRGPLHGIPVLVKDNIDTGGGMMTTAGSLAMIGPPARADAPLVARLRAAGAVILGKTNLSEWANFRSSRSSSGWSGRGRQTLNPHVLDRSPSGSSSGSAAAVAAGLAAAAIGTETDGSIISPSSMCGVVGFKPTVGAVSQAGIVPIAASQDTAGPHTRSVADALLLYQCMAGLESNIKLSDGGLRGKRIGVARDGFTSYSEHTDRIFENALAAMRDCGAEIVDPVLVAGDAELRRSEAEMTILLHEFKDGLNRYLATRSGLAVQSLDDLIAFNDHHAAEEMPYFGQELFVRAQATTGLTTEEYVTAKASALSLARTTGIDAVVAEHRLDALAAPSECPAFMIDLIDGDRFLGRTAQLAAVAGYPHITIPAGFAFETLPVGLSLFTTPDRELDLFAMAYAFEQATKALRAPRFVRTLSLP